MNKYRVAFFSECFGKVPYGGPAVRHYNIVKLLLEKGIFVKVIGSNPSQVHSDYKIDNLLENNLNINDFNIFWIEQSFKWHLVLNGKGILPIMGANIVPSSAPQHALPYVDEQGRNRQSSMEMHEQSIIKKCIAKFWLSQSDFQEKEYRRLGLPYDIPIYRAYNPIDIETFKPENKQTNSKPRILWLGKNNWAKQPEFLSQIAKKLPELEFNYISDEFTKMEFPSNVKKIMGRTNKEMPKLLNSADIYISTSVTENQPLAGLEAMACGLPVIAFRTSGWPEIVEHNHSGILVDLGNIDHFVVEIRRLLNDKNKRIVLGGNARKTILEKYSKEKCFKQYIEIFNKYLGE